MKNTALLPIYTRIEKEPVTLCAALEAAVFDFPFFQEGVGLLRKTLATAENYTLESCPDIQEQDLLDIKGFIFHTSHCGSTLLARMLNQSKQLRVVSETEAINGLLLAYVLYDLPRPKVLSHLKGILEAYRQPIQGEHHLVFKLTSWNVFFIDLFQELYPQTPWLYVDRDQEATLQSLLQSGNGFVQWWDHPVDELRRHFVGAGKTYVNKAAFLKDMLEKHRQHAHARCNEQACFIEYPEFIQQFEAITRHFGLRFEPDELLLAQGVTAFDSKNQKVLRV
ncbi:MAG TPA: hypothetical protein PKA00_04715 [Saprospiraceae bacterium]|nr:hypothetical protein [Saprospiraceae bacterium]HMQ82183.1 hypothetical protein [Saprospiraceae bacterium]